MLYSVPLWTLKAKGYRLLYPCYWIRGETSRTVSDGAMPDQLYYLSLVREVIDTGPVVRDGYTLEGKTVLPVRPHVLGEVILGSIARLSGSMDGMILFCSFVFPVVIGWLFYLWVYTLTGNRSASIVGVSVAMMGMYPAMRYAWGDLGASHAIVGVGPYNRIPHPMVSAVLFMFFLLVLSRMGEVGKRRMVFSILCGVSLGVMVYTYLFFWTYGLVLLLVWAGWLAYNRERSLALYCLLSVGLATLIAIPYLGLSMGIPAEIRHDYAVRETLYRTRDLWLSTLVPPSAEAAFLHFLGFLGVAVLLIRPEGSKGLFTPGRGGWLLLCGMLSALLASNQQVVTGLIIDPKHYYYRCFKVLLAAGIGVFWIYAVGCFVREKQARLLWLVPVLAMFAVGARVQHIYYKDYVERYNVSPGVDAALDWLNHNTPKGSVVLGGLGTSSVVAVYTHNNVLVQHGKDMNTDEKIAERLALWLSCWGMSEEDIRDYFEVPLRYQFFLNCVPWTYYEKHRDLRKLDEWIDRIVSLTKGIARKAAGYEVDFLLLGPEETDLIGRNGLPRQFTQFLAWEQGDCQIYDLRSVWKTD